jgi:FG-GAP-like repeat
VAAVVLVAGLSMAGLRAGQADDARQAAPVAGGDLTLEVTEDLSESLANDMLDLSVAARDRNAAALAPFFAPRIMAPPLAREPGPDRPEHQWFLRHGWQGAGDQAVISEHTGADVAGWLLAVLDHFDEIEDARFKVRQATFDAGSRVVAGAKVPTAVPGSRGRGTIAFFVVGRDHANRREWIRGSLEVVVGRTADRWQFEAITPKPLESMVATTDMFSEVSLPAGVDQRRPGFGEGGNDSFAWHGAAAADFDNDGWIDLFVTGPVDSVLYRNDGTGRFTDATDAAGLRGIDSGVAVLALDYDNDGDTDLFISAVGTQRLLENRLIPDGVLKFRDVSVSAGVAIPAIGFSAAAADVNNDGLLDIYVACYNYYGRVTPDSWFRGTNGTPNLLFINQGGGRFRQAANEWGVDDRRWSYAAAFADVNGDGRPDLYVANDFGENALFINHGNRFEDEATARGVVDPGNGMGANFGDYDNDGLLDLVVTNMSSTAGNRILGRLFPGASPEQNVLKKLASGNTLFRNTGDGHYRDVTAEAGGLAAGWAWGGGFIDFDNDGWQDLYFPNGFISGKSMKDT